MLDRLYEAGLTPLFVQVAGQAISNLGVATRRLHLVATSFHLHGHYPQEERQQAAVEGEQSEPIRITHGYSRDHRPDLKQFVVDLLCSGDGGIPLFFRAADGNDSDAATFAPRCDRRVPRAGGSRDAVRGRRGALRRAEPEEP